MISILMPIYNGIEFIDESVSSVIEQQMTEWELIIAINGLPSNSPEYQTAKQYVDKYPAHIGKIQVHDMHELRGKANTLNAMITLCKYDYIAILDVDDIWHPSKLQCQMSFLEKYDVIGTRCVYFGDREGIVPTIPLGDIQEVDFFKVNPIINSSALIRKELCYWNENGVEDYDLWVRLWKQGHRFYNCHEIVVKHRIHNASAFNAQGNGNKVGDMLAQYRK